MPSTGVVAAVDSTLAGGAVVGAGAVVAVADGADPATPVVVGAETTGATIVVNAAVEPEDAVDLLAASELQPAIVKANSADAAAAHSSRIVA